MRAMDWLRPRQERIEAAFALCHLADGVLVLYDVSSAAFEGRTCPLGGIAAPAPITVISPACLNRRWTMQI